MKFPPFLHSHLRLTLLGTPPNRVFLVRDWILKQYRDILLNLNNGILKLHQQFNLIRVTKIWHINPRLLMCEGFYRLEQPIRDCKQWFRSIKLVIIFNTYLLQWKFGGGIFTFLTSNKRQPFLCMVRRTSMIGICRLLNSIIRHPWGNCGSHVT